MSTSSENGEIEIYGVLKRSGSDNKLCYTNQLYDTTQNKFQSEINQNNIDYKNAIDNHLKDYTNPHKVSKEQVGLSNVTNDSQVKRSEMGQPLGVATLDKFGKVPESQLPSYVDDVLEFEDKSAFPDVGESGKIYVTLDSNITYRWTGSTYIEISKSLAIGETDNTAYMGSKGKQLEQNLANEIDRAKKSEATKYVKPETGIPNSDLAKEIINEIANKGVVNISTPSAGDTVVNIPIEYSSGSKNISIVEATEQQAGVLSKNDKRKLNNFNGELTEEEIKQIGGSLTQDDSTNVQFQLEKIQELYTQANTTIKGAETVDAELNGNILIVTRRDGSKQQVVLTDSDEHVTVNVTTTLASVSVGGIILNVYINNGADPLQYTTDSNGQAVFTVTKGSTYKVVFPYINGCAIVNPVQHIAAVGNRIIDVIYVEETIKFEHVTVRMQKANEDDVLQPWEGAPVHVTIGGKKTDYITDVQGVASFDVKIGTTYTVAVDKVDGMYEQYDNYRRTRKAIADSYRFNYAYHYYESGVWLVDDDGRKWTWDAWEASGKDKTHLVFVCIKTLDTQRYGGDIYISIDLLANFAQIPNKQWANQNVQFKNIPLDGMDNNNPQYYKFVYNGLVATITIIAEGDERGIETPFCDYCHSKTVDCAGEAWQGYGPTLEQWKLAWANIDYVVDAVNLKFPELGVSVNNYKGDKWTATQTSATNIYRFGTAMSGSPKVNASLAIPFFTCPSPSLSLSLSSEKDASEEDASVDAERVA